MKKCIFLLAFFVFTTVLSQTNEAILIKHKYDFQKENDSYNINNMFKGILLSSFNVYFDDEELPIEIARNRCNIYQADLLDNSNVFVTKLKFVIKDCQNKILFESNEMKSKEKSSQDGYIEVIKLLAPEVKKFLALRKQMNNGVIEPLKMETVNTVTPVTESTPSNSKYKFLEIQNGFAILDASPKVVLQIYKTSVQDVFIADKFGKKGVFYKKENKWYFEYYENDKLVTEEFVF